MADVIATIVIVLLFTVASVYIYKEKKKGSHCIGCPMAKNCARAIPTAGVLGSVGGKMRRHASCISSARITSCSTVSSSP